MNNSAKTASLTIERLALSQLVPHPKNYRTHPQPGTSAWEALRKSIEHDYFDPMVWNKRNGMLVSGHLRRKVLEVAGFTEADCVVVDYDEPMHLARMIAANRGAGEDDDAALKALLDELDAGGLDLELAGFADTSLEDVIEKATPEENEGLGNDVTDEVPVETQTYIVPIALTRKEYRAWESKQAEAGTKNHKLAFLKLLNIK